MESMIINPPKRNMPVVVNGEYDNKLTKETKITNMIL
jgi:hypothetical protein